MKTLISTILFFVITLISCNKKAKQQPNQEMSIMIPESGCYLAVIQNDSIWLKTEIFPNVVTGTLRYNFSEKDDNEGTLEGKLYGDTLVATYSFYSEGKMSKREVAFKLSKDNAVEGFGAVVENENGFEFENFSLIDFNSGTSFDSMPCAENDEQFRIYPYVENKGGSEELFSRVWQVISLNEKSLSDKVKKNPHVAFTAGQVNLVTGNGGCNDLRGNFELMEGHRIKFSPIGSTKMFCEDSNVENEFISLLDKVSRWTYDNETLILKNGTRPVIQLVPKD